jgi:uncharacterized protein
MTDIQLKNDPNGRGAFVIEEGEERLAEMQFGIKDKNLIVYHTEVNDKLKGQNIGSKLVSTMVEYARKENLKVVPLCAFVNAQFKRRPEQYADVWNKDWHH